jgi:hypothetical protein
MFSLYVCCMAGALNQLAEKIQARKPIPSEQPPASSKVPTVEASYLDGAEPRIAMHAAAAWAAM